MSCMLTGRALRNELLKLPLGHEEWLCPPEQGPRLEDEAYTPAPGSPRRYIDRASGDIYWPWCGERRAAERDELVAHCDASLDIEAVLAVRDLSIHAMARDPGGRLIDPYEGYEDLQQGFLRHVTPHFVRHPDYLLSLAEAAAELARWGFRVAHGTWGLMKKMANAGAVQAIEPQLRRASLRRALNTATPSEYFRVLHRCGALVHIAPALAGLYVDSASHSAAEAKPVLFEELDRLSGEGQSGAAVFTALLQVHAPLALSELGWQA